MYMQAYHWSPRRASAYSVYAAMPPRFVELIDLKSELQGKFGSLSDSIDVANVTNTIHNRAKTVVSNLTSTFHTVFNNTFTTLGVEDATVAFLYLYAPSTVPSYLIGIGAFLLLTRAILVELKAVRLVKRFGHAAIEVTESNGKAS